MIPAGEGEIGPSIQDRFRRGVVARESKADGDDRGVIAVDGYVWLGVFVRLPSPDNSEPACLKKGASVRTPTSSAQGR